jgi:hypothetical protein
MADIGQTLPARDAPRRDRLLNGTFDHSRRHEIITAIWRARARVPGFDPQLKTAVAAKLAGSTPRRLRNLHRCLATKIERRLFWRWSVIETISADQIA